MSIATVVEGDDLALLITLKSDGVVFDMSGKTVTARIVTRDRQSVLTAEIVQDAGASGADWSNSLVAVEMASGETADMDYQGSGYVEIQVGFPEKKTWFLPVQIVKGNIA